MKTNEIKADGVDVAGDLRFVTSVPPQEDPRKVGIREDYAEDIMPEDPVEASLSRTFRGLPMHYGHAARIAAFRYGMNMMGITEEDKFPNGTYPGMTDDMLVIVMTSLCSTNAGKLPECPESLRGLLLERTLRFNRVQLGEAIMRFAEGFEIDPMQEEIYNAGYAMLEEAAESEVLPTGTPGKREEGHPRAI